MKRASKPSLEEGLKNHANNKEESIQLYEGNTEFMTSTGSTLLDLAISGGRKKGGGIPAGILLEAFGPNGSGKTVLLCEIAGAIQRAGGDIMFNDPEARLNHKFASLFDFDTSELEINEPDTVTEVISGIQKWNPESNAKVHGVITDSLAALSTELEMENDEGDKMGMRRAKEFSEGLRKITRILKKKNYIMACSNQIREKANATGYGEKFTVPGGHAIGFYSSIRLRFHKPEKLTKKKTIAGKEFKKVFGTKVRVEVYKNSVDAPYRDAHIYILFDYGIDDVRANLQYMKDTTKATVYECDGRSLGKSMDDAIAIIEEEELEKVLRKEVIAKWNQIEKSFKTSRKKKVRH